MHTIVSIDSIYISNHISDGMELINDRTVAQLRNNSRRLIVYISYGNSDCLKGFPTLTGSESVLIVIPRLD